MPVAWAPGSRAFAKVLGQLADGGERCHVHPSPTRGISKYIKSRRGVLRHRTSEVGAVNGRKDRTRPCHAPSGPSRLLEPSSWAKRDRARQLRARPSSVVRLGPSPSQAEATEQKKDAANDAARDGRARSSQDLTGAA